MECADRFIEGDDCSDLGSSELARVAGRVLDIVLKKTVRDAMARSRRSGSDYTRALTRAHDNCVSVVDRLCNHPMARRATWLAMLERGADRPVALAIERVSSCNRAMKDRRVREKILELCYDVSIVERMMQEGLRGEYPRIFRRAVIRECVPAPNSGRWTCIFENATPAQLAELTDDDFAYALQYAGPAARVSVLGMLARWHLDD